MNEYQRDQYLGRAVEVSDDLLSKGIVCSTRQEGTSFYISGDFTAVELDAALIDFIPLTNADKALDAHIASTGLNMDRTVYTAVREQLQTLRSLRQLGRNAFMGLSAAERDRLIYDALTAQTIIDLAILRDE